MLKQKLSQELQICMNIRTSIAEPKLGISSFALWQQHLQNVLNLKTIFQMQSTKGSFR